ncbi:MAG: hypothetical protein RL329_116 [Bacteroidota bacterium]|jgi:hypothetical protein
MKHLKIVASLIAFFFCANQMHAQLIITEYIKVKDFNSGLSRQAVEDAVYSKGVKDVKWDEDIQMFTVSYEWRKTTMGDIREKVDNLVASMSRLENHPESFERMQERKRAAKIETASK